MTSVASLIKQSETRYKQKLADETSKVIADNPLAYEYDTLYDDIKAEQDQQRSLKTVKKDVSASFINEFRHHSRDTLSKW